MNEEFKNIEEILASEKKVLSSQERHALWSRIELSLPTARGVVSPYVQQGWFSMRTLVPTALVVAVLAAGGTAATAEAARPGDALFSIDRAIEDIRLRLARTDETRAALTHTYAEERLSELREIVDEERTQSVDTSHGSSTRPASDRIDHALIETLRFLDSASASDTYLDDIRAEVDGFEVRIDDERIRIRNIHNESDRRQSDEREDSDRHVEPRVQYRSSDGNVRIEQKNGEVRVKQSGHSSDERDASDDSDGDSVHDSSGDRDDDNSERSSGAIDERDTEDNDDTISSSGSSGDDRSSDEDEDDSSHHDPDNNSDDDQDDDRSDSDGDNDSSDDDSEDSDDDSSGSGSGSDG